MTEEIMKIDCLLALAVLAIGFAVPTLAQQKDTVDPKIEQQIRMLATKYDSAINRHDADAIAALYTQDAVFWTHHDGSFHGRNAIEKECTMVFQTLE
jgi:ketosteroid isomerase-like protein